MFLRLHCLDITFKHTNGLFRCQGLKKKCKKADLSCKGQNKGQRAKNVKILDFFVVLGLFGVNNAVISLFSSFKAKKAKKAAIVAVKAKLQMKKFVVPKICLLYTSPSPRD